VRFEPGDTKRITLVELGGSATVYGLNALTNGPANDSNKPEALERARAEGFIVTSWRRSRMRDRLRGPKVRTLECGSAATAFARDTVTVGGTRPARKGGSFAAALQGGLRPQMSKLQAPVPHAGPARSRRLKAPVVGQFGPCSGEFTSPSGGVKPPLRNLTTTKALRRKDSSQLRESRNPAPPVR